MVYKIRFYFLLSIASVFVGFTGCSSSSNGVIPTSASSSSSSSSGNTITPSSALIKVNQVGYRPESKKVAIIPDNGATAFEVRHAADDSLAYEGALTPAATWTPSGDSVRQADFTSLSLPGRYYISVTGLANSHSFEVADGIYEALHTAANKAYYFNRASTALESQYAGDWARAMGHPDDQVRVHSSAATTERPTGTLISAPKGWYDAGDYNKYIVNSGISTYTLLAAYEHFSGFYQSRTFNIPESTDNVPDILNEIMWNLDWMEAMQDTDGGVYHKLTTQNFSGIIMPNQGTAQRYVVQKTTAATLNFAAVMAVASRVFGEYSVQFPGKAASYRSAAIDAWAWASQNNDIAYSQPSDINTGTYGDATFADEFAWAAAELFLLTEEPAYFSAFQNQSVSPSTPYWGGVSALGFISLSTSGQNTLSPADFESVNDALVTLADSLLTIKDASAYDIAMRELDFVWGSNSAVLNQAMMVLQAYRITGESRYKDAAQGMLDYALGRNATDYAFVTGFGTITPLNPHHRPSEADSIAAPVPGFLVGGPHSGQQDRCAGYPSSLPALSYLDDWCSYSTNEVTINWNAPLVYVLAALQTD